MDKLEEFDSDRDCDMCSGTFEEMKACGGFIGCLKKQNVKIPEYLLKAEGLAVANCSNNQPLETAVNHIKNQQPETAVNHKNKEQLETAVNHIKNQPMESVKITQTIETTKEATEQAAETVSVFGKFKNAEELLRAYNALEAEFTKRCQKFKELANEADRLRCAQAPEQNAEKDFLSLLEDEEFLDSVIIHNPKVKMKIIEGYLRALEGRAPAKVLTSGCGRTALQPAAVPRTLEEARRLANLLLGGV